MKIRWNEQALRLRITPSELETLRGGGAVVETMPVGGWQMILDAGHPQSALLPRGSQLHLHLSVADLEQFLEPTVEGVYLQRGDFRYYVEKDFPCEHPRPAEVLESSETFPRPGDTRGIDEPR
jgi:hypothetical protein